MPRNSQYTPKLVFVKKYFEIKTFFRQQISDPNLSTNDKISHGFIAGWGKTDLGQTGILNEATVPILSNEDCNYSHGATSMTRGQLCAGFSEGGVDSCEGDAGGPLVVIDENNQKRLAGIISWAQGYD